MQAILVAGVALLSLGLGRDLHVPITFSSDALVFLAQSKSTLDNGWWWINHRLGAPLGFQALLFPANTNVDQAFVWMAGTLVGDPILAITLAWIAMLAAGGCAATYCFRLLGCSRLAAFVAGVLFGLSPYALYRHIDHFSLATYLVPFPATLALMLMSGRIPDLRRWRTVPLLAGCILLGFNYVYYAFFACFFIAVATIFGFWGSRDPRLLRTGGAMLGVIVLCAGLNLLPSYVVMRSEGTPTLVRPKVPAEAEVYALKIRQLVSPVSEHRFKPFRSWTEKEAAAGFPLDTENTISRLGAVASLGFLSLLALLMLSRPAAEEGLPLLPAARLTTAGVLLATMGGFGSLFNLLVAPDIRAYNRICPFLVVFALLAVAAGIDAVSRRRRGWGVSLALVVLVLGVWDQAQALRPLRKATSRIASEYRPLVGFVSRLETLLPAGTMVLQLPFTTYLNDAGNLRMGPYDHLKPYLASRSLRWSYPAISDAQYRWQEAASKLDLPQVASLAGLQGFRAIWIDKFGYPDGAAGAIETLASVAGTRMILQNERYAALEIGPGVAPVPPHRQPLEEFLQDRPITPSLPACGEAPVVCFDQVGGVGPSCAPAAEPIAVPRSRSLSVSGWAVAPGSDAGLDVEVAVDATAYPAFYGFERTDVAEHFKSPAAKPSGFRTVIPAGKLAAGSRKLTVRLVARDRDCYFEGWKVELDVR
jgi:phosphoglycerol transferase